MIKILFEEKVGGNLFYKQENLDTTKIKKAPNSDSHYVNNGNLTNRLTRPRHTDCRGSSLEI